MRYEYYLLDADDTLYDFKLAQKNALARTLASLGLPAGDAQIARFDAINARLWKLRETGGITQQELVVRRFTEFLEGKADDRAASVSYLEALSSEGPMLPGALEVLRALKERGAKIAIVTNGVGKTQRGRFAGSGAEPLVDALVISEEVGAFKPDPAMIEAALAKLACPDRGAAVMVGDNLSTDILAAQRADIASCWYNPGGVSLPEGFDPPTHTIRSIGEVLTL